jgi:hypothetical protein
MGSSLMLETQRTTVSVFATLFQLSGTTGWKPVGSTVG